MGLGRSPASRIIIVGLALVGILLLVLIAMRVMFPTVPTDAGLATRPVIAIEETPLVMGKRLYANYCAACHGDKGDGNGPAAKYLYPKPRKLSVSSMCSMSVKNAKYC